MKIHASIRAVATVALCAACVIGGCASQPNSPRVVVADGGQLVTPAELDGLTRAFADRYVGLLYSACDAVKRDNPDAVQRREAQVLLADASSNVYDIASNADAFTRLLDLVVVTRLMSHVWSNDGRAALVFGDRAGPLTDALLHARTEAQALASRVLTVEQLATVDSLLLNWRKENPGMVRASFVRFSVFAVGRGSSAASEVLAAGGLFSNIGQAGQAVDEARLLGERMFYQLKREPTLVRWQAAAAQNDLLATPEIATALADVHRLTNLAEQMPAHFAAEREAVVAAVDSGMNRADATLARVKDVVAETQSLVASLKPASQSLDQLVKSADSLFARYDAWDRWTFEHDSRPFDIREYTKIVQESAATTERLNELIKSSKDLLASPHWGARIDDWNRSADGRIAIAAEQSQLLMDGFFRKVYFALGGLFALLVCYRVICALLERRMAIRGMTPGELPSYLPLGRAKG